MNLVHAGTTYYFHSFELGGMLEDRTAYLKLKDSAGNVLKNWKFLESLEGFVFTQDAVVALLTPTLSATPVVGTAVVSTPVYTATPAPAATLAYQWELSADGSTGWANITSATAATYTPVAGDATKQVRVKVTATGSAIGQAYSAASGAIAHALATATITGTTKVGETLTAGATYTGTGSPSGPTLAYVWERSDDGEKAWAAIESATSATYQLAAADEGKYVRVKITATGTAVGVKYSDATEAIAGS